MTRPRRPDPATLDEDNAPPPKCPTCGEELVDGRSGVWYCITYLCPKSLGATPTRPPKPHWVFARPPKPQK